MPSETRYGPFDRALGRYQVRWAVEHAVGQSVLDLGCGDGTHLPLLAERFGRVVGVDCCAESVQAARSQGAGEIHQADAATFDAQERFDTVLATMLLEHVDDPIAVLRNGARLLAPNGLFIVQVPNGESLHRRLGVHMGLLESPCQLTALDLAVGHRRVYNHLAFYGDTARAGLVGRIGGLVLKPFANAQLDALAEREGPEWLDSVVEALASEGRARPYDCAVLCAQLVGWCGWN